MLRLNKKNNLTVVLIFLVLFLILGLVIYQNIASNPQKTTVSKLPITPTPTLVPKTAITSQNSIEGDVILVLETKEKLDNQIGYSLFVANKESLENLQTEELIFSETINGGTNVELPFNTWSPDKKHFFIERQIGDSIEYLVFNGSGEEFQNDPASDLLTANSFININDLYVQAEIPFELDEITGWAAPYLLVVKTKKNANEEGPSYWFDVSRQNFIQLFTKF